MKHSVLILVAVLLAAFSPACDRPDRSQPAGASTHSRIVPANGAALDLLSEFIGPERLVGLPRTVLENANVEGEGWAALPTLPGLSVEELLSREVDWVVAHDWQEPAMRPVLESAGIPVLFLPTVARIEDLDTSLRTLGSALGQSERAEQVLGDLHARLDRLQQQGVAIANKSAMVYSNYGAGGGTAGSDTSYDLMIRWAGLKNAAAEAGIAGHRDLDLEGLLAIQPDILIVSKGPEGQSPALDTLKAALDSAPLHALTLNRIVHLPGCLLTTTSQYLVDAAEELQRQALQWSW
ncbi:MAG: ABC transporter substrate-binding protein [Planctomycetota bacterium]